MTNAIELKNVCKQYDGFTLKDLTLTLPAGQVMGFLGENGAGKTTAIKAILGLIRTDGGSIRLLGRDAAQGDTSVKEEVGAVLDECPFPPLFSAAEVEKSLRRIYKSWDAATFARLCQKLGLDKSKPVKDYSKGMKTKLSLAAALAHQPRLLILDEPTSGLDPVVREEILDIFREFIQDESHAILFSSHITSDLDKIADSVAFLHKGRLLFCREKDELLEDMGILRCARRELSGLGGETIERVRQSAFGCEALIRDRRGFIRRRPGMLVDPVHLEDIMLFYIKGEKI